MPNKSIWHYHATHKPKGKTQPNKALDKTIEQMKADIQRKRKDNEQEPNKKERQSRSR